MSSNPPESTVPLSEKIAISLKYQETMSAPTVTAKGIGHIAEQILAIAKENNIPIKTDNELTELLSKVELDSQIPEALYAAIAQVLIFAYELSGKEIPHQK